MAIEPDRSLQRAIAKRARRRASGRSQKRARHLACEHLEDRRPLAADLLSPQAALAAAIANADLTRPLADGEMQPILLGYTLEELRVDAPDNVNAADTTNTEDLQPGGSLGLDLTGAGFTVGVWEAGGLIRDTHQEFGGRVTLEERPSGSDFSNHATHVAGTIGAAGVDPDARGMASEVLIRGWTSSNDENEVRDNGASLDFSNHSYGTITGWSVDDGVDRWYGDYSLSPIEDVDFGRYSSSARRLDEALVANPNLLSVWSAGNDRNDSFQDRAGDNTYLTFFSSDPGLPDWSGPGVYRVPNSGATIAPPGDGNGGTGYDSVAGNKVAKNGLVVGAVSDVLADPYSPSSVSLASFSSFGGTDDGRIKPDVVGNGVSLYSSRASSDSAYGNSSGTSMAAPNVSGTAVLLAEHYTNLFGQKPLASTSKGLLIHTATDVGNPGPDYAFGWGLVDARAAAEKLTAVADAPADTAMLISEEVYNGNEYNYAFSVDGSGPVKATIVWTDPASPTITGLDNPTRTLVNDLDLWITGPDGTIYNPWTLDPTSPTEPAVRTARNDLDNVEQVLIDFPTAGEYTLSVGATGLGFVQAFSVLLSGPEPEPVPTINATVDVLLSADDTPTLTGTVSDPTAELFIDVGGQTGLEATNLGDGTWVLNGDVLSPLEGGVYDVAVLSVLDTSTVVDVTSNELTIDTDGGQASVTSTVAIDIPGEGTSGNAAPYPGVISVEGFEGELESLEVRLLDLDHTFPGDVEVLLSAPDGQSVILMADNGRGTDLVGVDLTFSDDAATTLGDDAITAGVYKPLGRESGSLPAPAPNSPYASQLADLTAGGVNGEWSLYIFDDAGSDSGRLVGGWGLDFEIVRESEVSVEPVVAASEEGDDGTTQLTFEVVRAGDINQPSTIDWSVTGAGESPVDAADFVGGELPSGSVTLESGEASAPIVIPVLGDTLLELDEQFTLTIANPTFGTLGESSVAGTIVNDDSAEVSIEPPAAPQNEGDSGVTAFDFRLTRTGDVSQAVSVGWEITLEGDLDDADFVTTNGMVVVPADESVGLLTVNARGDIDAEEDEPFTVRLTGVSFGEIGVAEASAVLVNDDQPYTGELIVDTVADVDDGVYADGERSLREMIRLANQRPGDDVISFATSMSGETIELIAGELSVTEALTIDATELSAKPVIDAQGLSRVAAFDGVGPFAIRGLDLRRGATTADSQPGGALRAGSESQPATLVLDRVAVTESSTSGGDSHGGGIFVFGEVRLLSSLVSGNQTLGPTSPGGGVWGDNVIVEGSTIMDNRTSELGADGGGVYSAGSAEVRTSTISGNRTDGAGADGAGLFTASGHLQIMDSTIANNSALGDESRGGGILQQGDLLTIEGSIVATNTAISADADVGINEVALVSVSYTLIGTTNGLNPDQLASIEEAPGNLTGDEQPIDPGLATLGDNGGPVPTHALLPGSVASNAGDPSRTYSQNSFDQRGEGFLRVVGGRVDIGSFEIQATPPELSGDFDRNGVVDTADYAVWKASFGSFVPPSSGADGNGDGRVDTADFTVWRDALSGVSPLASKPTPQDVGDRNENVAPPNTTEDSLLASAVTDLLAASMYFDAGPSRLEDGDHQFEVTQALASIPPLGQQTALLLALAEQARTFSEMEQPEDIERVGADAPAPQSQQARAEAFAALGTGLRV
ncbi:MAG: S8 family serine peptidase [Planctomycetota bacterium]